MRQGFGCPVSGGHPWRDGYGDGWAGASSCLYKPSTSTEHVTFDAAPKWMRTCPQYYASSPFAASIFDDLDDYTNNRLGNVLDLPYPYLVYLRVASSEKQAWADWWTAEMQQRASKKNG